TVNIYNEPTPDFDLPSTSPICTNQEYLFTNNSTFDAGSNPSWQWEVNGVSVSSDQDLTYAIPAAVMQDVKLIASIPGCSNEITKTINTVEEGPLANFTFSNDCEDNSISFTNTTIGSVTGYTWNFGDGNMSSQANGSNVYSDFGQYDVTLEATNAAGCVNTSIQPITIYSKPQPDFSLDLPPFSCNGSPSQFNDLTPNPVDSNLDSWIWNFGDPQSGTSIARNPQYVYALAGQYNVTLDVTTNFGCTGSVQKQINISQSPGAEFTFNPACVNQGTTFTPASTTGVSSWQWNIGTSTYNQQNPTHVFSSPSTYSVQLTANGSNGCIGVLSKSVNVPVPPNVDFVSENNCANQSTVFTDATSSVSDPVMSRAWQFGALGTGTGVSTNFTFESSGSYPTKLTVTNESGCSYSLSKSIAISNSPTATFSATPQIGTPPLTVQLTNTSSNIISQLWDINDGQSSSTDAAPAFTFNALGQYVVDLTVFNQQGCSATSSKIISVIVPSLDVALKSVMLLPASTGETNILVTLTNKSNSPVSNLRMLVDVSGGALLSERITAVIQPGQDYSQVLAAGIVGAKGDLDYVCVNVILDGDVDDTNNRKCLNQESSTIVLDPYPNPGSDFLNLDWISVAAGDAVVTIFDRTGRKVFENTFTGINEGLNQASVSLSPLNPGIYYVLFVAADIRKTFPFVVKK
ncbi:MAG: PKD domain-containing protein, partial [Cyclobacteriaceae bacterium]